MVNIITALKKIANKLISLNNSKLDIATMQALYGTRTALTVSSEPADNWTLTSYSAILMGDKILVYVNATRDSALTAGNFSNEVIGTFTCQTLGAISNAYAIPIVAENYGNMITAYPSSPTISGTGTSQTLSFGITISAGHSAVSQLTFRFFIPVRPNLSYYNLS